jgi:ribosomal protein L37AE/L43A
MRSITAQYPGTCPTCKRAIEPGNTIFISGLQRVWRCSEACAAHDSGGSYAPDVSYTRGLGMPSPRDPAKWRAYWRTNGRSRRGGSP